MPDCLGVLRKKKQMFAPGDQDNSPPRSFTNYVIQMALEQIDALSDSLIAIQSSDYEVERIPSPDWPS